MRRFAITINPKVDGILVDTCGTGGDFSGTFNVSTVSAFVAAGAGVPIVKHGNRSISSRCGSADVLEELGVNLCIEPMMVEEIMQKINISFLFAPNHHPAMRYARKARREMGIRTVFNLLGPLTNPANAQAQILGVYSPELTEKLTSVLKLLGSRRAIVVHGSGLDEISTVGNSVISELRDGEIKKYTINCEEFGIKPAKLKDLKGGGAKESACIMLRILEGDCGPPRDITLMNAGAAIYIGGKADSIREGIKLAETSIDSGKALEKLNLLIQETRDAV
jgi:anthranilate phosphoribosyltransferase